MLVCGKTFCITMEDQVPSSNPPQFQGLKESPIPGGITPELLEQMKARAREEAIRMTILQQQAAAQEQAEYPTAQPEVPSRFQIPQQQVVYVRRNLTVAELILVFAISCGLVTGIQAAWNFASNNLPRIEIKAR
jgi:hypothetical protein